MLIKGNEVVETGRVKTEVRLAACLALRKRELSQSRGRGVSGLATVWGGQRDEQVGRVRQSATF